LADRALRLLYERGGAAFRFEGLRAFKEKWHPRWEPRFLCYEQDTELPRVAAAVARAGELADPRAPRQRLIALGRRFPFTAALVGLTTWLMIVSAIDVYVYRQFNRHLALGWQDLMRLQLWRLPTAQLLQDRPGWVWSILVMMVVLVPLAEWRLRSGQTIVLFFLGDWCSTLPVLVAMRAAAVLGSSSAATVVARRDSGSSSGLWALAAALAWSMPNRRARLSVLAVEGAALVGPLLRYHRLFDFQHLLAAAAGLGLAADWTSLIERTRRQPPRSDTEPHPARGVAVPATANERSVTGEPTSGTMTARRSRQQKPEAPARDGTPRS
jgi:hypothetical protein